MQYDAGAIDSARNEIVRIDKKNETGSHDRTTDKQLNPGTPPGPRPIGSNKAFVLIIKLTILERLIIDLILQIYEKLPDFPFASDYFPQKPQYLNFFRLYLHIQS